jgi:hypothetical protein
MYGAVPPRPHAFMACTVALPLFMTKLDGRVTSITQGRREMHIDYWWENPRERENLQDLDVDVSY